MTSEKTASGTIFDRILRSRGMQFRNLAHARTFSLNMLEMNGLELMEAVRRIRDPDQGLSLLSQDNREAGTQAHREVSRHIHNFLAAAKTLVDHTRVFMEENYSGAAPLQSYRTQIVKTLATEPVVKFVHDLRNYMLHKGPPDTQMFASFERDPVHPKRGLELRTGVQVPVASLLGWSGWTSPARSYIKQAGEALDIHTFVEAYLGHIASFHRWLDLELEAYHREDLAELAALQLDLDAAQTADATPPETGERIAGTSERQLFTFAQPLAEAVNKAAQSMLVKIRPVRLQHRPKDDFPGERFVAATITGKDIIGTPVFHGQDVDGVPVVTFVERDDDLFGMNEADFSAINELGDLIYQEAWARGGISRAFVEGQFIRWAREAYGQSSSLLFAEAFCNVAKTEVRSLEVWAPVAHLEIQETFNFGPVKLCPITAATLHGFRSAGADTRPPDTEGVEKFFEGLRRTLQGLAAVVVPLMAEPSFAQDRALLVARDAVSLLRVFSPGAALAGVLCPTALLGSELVPQSKLLVSSRDSFSMTEKVLPAEVAFWRLSQSGIRQLEAVGLDRLGSLVDPSGLSPFASDLRSSLMIYSRGLTSPDGSYRLSQAFSALEGVLLRHQFEPRQVSVAERVSFLLAPPGEGRLRIADAIRQGYKIFEQPSVAPPSPREDEWIAQAIALTHGTLLTALENLDGFRTRRQFIEGVDQLSRSSEG